MRWLHFAVGFLWVVVGLAVFGLISVLSADAMPAGERTLAVLLLAGFGGIAAWQLHRTHQHLRDMTANRVVLGREILEIQLGGRAREWKGLPEVPPTRIPWSDALSIVAEKKRFVYPSAIPMGYPLDVFTLYTRTGGISFTRECVPDAKKIAHEIAAKLGTELH